VGQELVAFLRFLPALLPPLLHHRLQCGFESGTF
jgi:hypothetical protein